MVHIKEVNSVCAQQIVNEALVATEEALQETDRQGQIEIEDLDSTSFQTLGVSSSASKSNTEFISQTDQSNAVPGHPRDDITKVLAATKSLQTLDMSASHAQSTGTFQPKDLVGGIARSRKGMKLNDPKAFSELAEPSTSLDTLPVLQRLGQVGCSTPSFVARQKLRLQSEKGERLVSEVVYTTALINAGPAYDQPGNTTSPNDQPSISSANVAKNLSVITDSGDVSVPDKEEVKDILAPRWMEESTRVYTTCPAVVETMVMVEDLVPTPGPGPDLDLQVNKHIEQLEGSGNLLSISSTRMMSPPAEESIIPHASSTSGSTSSQSAPYGSGVELEVLGGIREGFNDGSSDEEVSIDLETNDSWNPAYGIVARNQRKTAKRGFFRRVFGTVAKQINKLKKPTILNTSASLGTTGPTASTSTDLAEAVPADDAEPSPEGVKKRTVRHRGEAVTFSKTLN